MHSVFAQLVAESVLGERGHGQRQRENESKDEGGTARRHHRERERGNQEKDTGREAHWKQQHRACEEEGKASDRETIGETRAQPTQEDPKKGGERQHKQHTIHRQALSEALVIHMRMLFHPCLASSRLQPHPLPMDRKVDMGRFRARAQ